MVVGLDSIKTAGAAPTPVELTILVKLMIVTRITGTVMATVLRYVIGDLRTSRRAEILSEFRISERILQLFQRGVRELRTSVVGE